MRGRFALSVCVRIVLYSRNRVWCHSTGLGMTPLSTLDSIVYFGGDFADVMFGILEHRHSVYSE